MIWPHAYTRASTHLLCMYTHTHYLFSTIIPPGLKPYGKKNWRSGYGQQWWHLIWVMVTRQPQAKWTGGWITDRFIINYGLWIIDWEVMGNLQSCVNGSHSTALPSKCVCVHVCLPTCKFYAFMHTAIISSGVNRGLYLGEKMQFSRFSSFSLIINFYCIYAEMCWFLVFLISLFFVIFRFSISIFKYWTDTITCSLWFISVIKSNSCKSTLEKFTQFLYCIFFSQILIGVIGGYCICWHRIINDCLFIGV